MGALTWLVAPALKDHFAGDGNVPMLKALLICLTAVLIWQFVLVAFEFGRRAHLRTPRVPDNQVVFPAP